MQTQQAMTATSVTEQQFREGVMPRAQLSKLACEIAIEKTTRAEVKEFAGWELMEANTVINVLKDLQTEVPPVDQNAQAFLSRLKNLNGNEFDKEYMAAELLNHDSLRELAQNYINGVDEKLSANEGEIWHVAKLALFAFTEHVGLCKKIMIGIKD